MSIKFLNIEEASQEYSRTDYFSQMNYIELIFRLNTLKIPYYPNDNCTVLRKRLLEYYFQLVSNFTDSEQNIIRFYFTYLFQKLVNKSPKLIPRKKPINLIKLRENVEWNYPYTINHCIVLPTKFIVSLITTYQQINDQYQMKPLD